MSTTPPWGHKLTVSIYVEGDKRWAEWAAEWVSAGASHVPHVDFVGIAVEAVEDQPIDQAAT